MMKHVFISYARKDATEFACRLHDDLEREDIPAWLDIRDILGGADWDLEIDKGLENAQAVVVLLTPASIISTQVKSEWNSALNRKVAVIPLLLIECEIPRVLSIYNYIDFRSNYDTGIAKLRTTLLNIDKDIVSTLKNTLAALEVEQETASDPCRFEDKIVDLKNTIAHLTSENSNIQEKQREWKKELQDHFTISSPPKASVGQKPYEVIDFFKDRVNECLQVCQLLAEPATRIVSIIGHGGMGKTALASKILADLERNHWPHSAEQVPIEGIIYMSTRTDGISLERLFLNCAELLGGSKKQKLYQTWTESQLNTQAKISYLLEEMGDKPYLFLLDNMEDLIDTDGNLLDPEIEMFLRSNLTKTSTIRLLITSRIPLTFAHDVMRHDKKVPLLEGLPLADAVALLIELDPSGACGLRDASQELLERAVELVHRIPRALEILAAILANDPFITLEDILQQFYKHDIVIQQLVEYSYRRLDNDARRVMEAMAVFGVPVPVVALNSVLEKYASGLDVPQIVRRLIRTHNVNFDPVRKTVSLHPIDRDYIYSQLPESV